MKLRLLISISLLALTSKAVAQSADDFFDSGARSYLSNNIPGAKQEVAKGLKLYPKDIKLQKLDELLKQQQQQQQNQQQQQQQNQSQQNQSQSKQKQQQQQQQQQNQQQQQQNQQNAQQQKDRQSEQEKKAEEQQQKEQQAAAGQMTPEQAKQLMDQAKADELLLPASHKQERRDQDHPIKDW